MTSTLKQRLNHLERRLAPRRFANAAEVSFALWRDRLPEGTPVPEGARIVTDFHASITAQGWGGRPGTVFRSGFEVERLTSDPADVGRIIDENGRVTSRRGGWSKHDQASDPDPGARAA